MRPSCLFCARKHLGQAAVLLGEAANGYPEHVWLAIGHMAEASDELIASYPDMAREIRAARKPLETSPSGAPAHVDIMGLITRVSALENAPIGVSPQILGLADALKTIGAAARPSDRIAADFLPTTLDEVRAQDHRPSAPVYHVSADGKTMIPDNGGPAIPVPPLPGQPGGPPAATPCLECADKAVLKALAEQLERERIGAMTGLGTGPVSLGGGAMAPRARGRIAILTTLGDFRPSYSLTSVVLEQAHAAALAGYRVILFVHRKADLSLLPALPPEISVLPVVPRLNLREDVVDEAIATDLVAAMIEWFGALTHGVDRLDIISHDLLFQSWFVTFAKAIHDLQGIHDRDRAVWLGKLRWWHMAHSSVGSRPEITAIPGAKGNGGIDSRYWRHTLPRGHQLLILNYADARFFADYYHQVWHPVGSGDPLTKPLTTLNDSSAPSPIHVLRNSRDLRPFLHMGPNANFLTTRYQLHLADVFMIYPLSIERAADKGMRNVLQLLGSLKRLGLRVRLLLAAAHTNGDKAEKSIAWIKSQAFAAGLVYEGKTRPATPDEVAAYQQANPNVAANAVSVGGTVTAEECDVIFSHEAFPADRDVAVYGLPADDVRALWQVSNLFIFPTVSEAGPLVLMEAALAGCTLVLNASLPALADYVPRDLCLSVAWGSSKEPAQGEMTPERLEKLADQVWRLMQKDRAAVLKRRMFQQHSLEAYGQALVEILDPEPVDVQVARQDLPDDVGHPPVAGTALDSMRRHPGPVINPEDVIHPADVGRTSWSKDQPPQALGYDPDAAP